MSVLRDEIPILTHRFQPSNRQSAETMLLLHGNGFNSSLWGEMASRLNENFHLLFIDLQSGFQGDITWDSLCDALQDVLAQRNIEALHVVGHSYGGSLAVAFADRYPERVITLVLLSIVVFYPSTEGEQVLYHYLSLIAREGLKTIVQREILPYLTLDREGGNYEALKRAYDEMDEAYYLRLFKMQMHQRPIDETLAIACPTLLLAGERDELYLPTLQSITAGFFRRGTFLVVPRAANAVFIDQPWLTAQWILDFIAKSSEPEPYSGMRSSLSGHLPAIVRSAVQAVIPAEPALEFEPVLSLTLFHAFQVRLNGEPISEGWDKRYAKNILAYLAMHRSGTREELCDALFPELNRLTALNNLRVYLGHLKKQLELPDGSSVLQTGRKRITLNASIDCDLRDYSETLKRIVFIADGEEKYAAIQAFLPRLGSAPFMTGIYDQWFIDGRSDIEELIASLSQWASSWEARMNRPDSALFFEKIAGRLLDDPM